MQKVNKQAFIENATKANFNEITDCNEGSKSVQNTHDTESTLTIHELYLQCLVEDDN